MAKDAYYFSHDTNARRDPKILAMRSEYGAQGYGWYWIIVEMLAEQEDYKLKHKQWVTNAIAMEMQCQPNEAETFVKDCIEKYELFESDGEYFWSNSLIKRMKLKEEKRMKKVEAGRKGAMKRWNKEVLENDIAYDKQSDSTAIADQKQTNSKNSKVKESKVNNNIYTCEFEEFWSHYPRKKEKKKAFTKWKARLKEGYKPEDLIKAAINYANECKKKETEETYIKHGATFLGPDKPFEDYIKQEIKEEKIITHPSFRPAEEVLKGRDLSELIDESLLRGTS